MRKESNIHEIIETAKFQLDYVPYAVQDGDTLLTPENATNITANHQCGLMRNLTAGTLEPITYQFIARKRINSPKVCFSLIYIRNP